MIQSAISSEIIMQEVSVFPGAGTFPTFAHSLIGRQQEIVTICSLLQQSNVRLLTLLGAGGIGKTRLAIEAATHLKHIFVDGLYFIPLVTIAAPDMVMDAIAQTLELQTDTQQPVFEQIKAYVGSRRMLLLLDNFEQLISGALLIEQLLIACPHVSVLVTSRASLHIPREQRFLVPPLPVPSVQEPIELPALALYPSVALFVRQARTRLPSFQLTESNAASIAALCVRLDGLPLALELAAARITLLSPAALLSRLSRCLPLLNKGDRTRPPHQQTLQGTIEWSYKLLSAPQQQLFRRLAAFASTFSLAAVEQISLSLVSPDVQVVSTVLDDIDALIDHSLLQPPVHDEKNGEPRFSLLEMLREFALERLVESGEMVQVKHAHALCYLHLMEEVAPLMQGAEQGSWARCIEQEYANVHAAMNWLLEQEEAQTLQKKELALRLGYALHSFWVMRGHLQEGALFMEQALAMEGAVSPLILAQGFLITSGLLMRQGNLERAAFLAEKSLALFRSLGNQKQCAQVLRQAGWLAQQQGDKERASALYRESYALFTALDDQSGIANILLNMAFLAEVQGDYEEAFALYADALRRQRVLKDARGISNILYQLVEVRLQMSDNLNLPEIYALLDEGTMLARSLNDTRTDASFQGLRGQLALYESKFALARTLLQECLDFHSQGGDRLVQGHYLVLLGRVAIAEHAYERAESCFEEALAIGRMLNNDAEVISSCLEGMASLAITRRQHPWAVQLMATAARLRHEVQYPLPPRERAAHAEEIARLKHFLGEQRFTSLWEAAYAFTLDEVLTARWKSIIAVEPNSGGVSHTKAPTYPAGLTKREVQVLRLVAQGLTDAQIAEQLVISVRTVTTHLTSIYNKLGVSSRVAATGFAVEHALL